MVPVGLTPAQVLLIYCDIVGSVLATCFVLSRFNFLPMDTSVGRYTHIDGLRGIAALFVFTCHTSIILLMSGIQDIYFHYRNLEMSGKFGSVGVQIFFCITGFLFTEIIIKAKNGINWGKFFTNRFKRLAPLYFFATTASIIFAFIMGDHAEINIGHTFINWLKVYAFGFIPLPQIFGYDVINVMGNIWTLPYEWRFYFLMPVFFWFIKDGVWRIALPILLVLAIISLSVSDHTLWPLFLGGSLTAFLANAVHLQRARSKWICTILAIGAIAIPMFDHAAYFGLQTWAMVSIGFALIMLGEPPFLKFKTVRFLGEISYSFYLLGVLFAASLFHTFKHLGNPAHLHFLGFLRWELITSVCFVVVCTLTFRFIEYPFLHRKKTQSANAPVLSVSVVAN